MYYIFTFLPIDTLKPRNTYMNPLDDSKRTPLHDAAYGGHTEVCDFLLQNLKQNTRMKKMKDKNGLPPYDIAKRPNNVAIAAFQKYFAGR